MRLSRRWKAILAALVVLGILAFLDAMHSNRAACPPGSCPLIPVSGSR